MNSQTRDNAIFFGSTAAFLAIFFAVNVLMGVPFMEPDRLASANSNIQALYVAK